MGDPKRAGYHANVIVCLDADLYRADNQSEFPDFSPRSFGILGDR